MSFSTTTTHSFSIIFFLYIMLLTFPAPARTDQPCTYPCNPPPMGGTPTTTTVTPAPPQTGGTTYSPPTGYNNYPYFYNQPPPSGFTGNGGYYGAPPPPEPILPYFPFYYRRPPHRTGTGEFSASSLSLVSIVWRDTELVISLAMNVRHKVRATVVCHLDPTSPHILCLHTVSV